MDIYIHQIHAGGYKNQKRALDPMEGQLQVVVSNYVGAEAKPRSSMWERDTHNLWSIILAYIYSLWVNIIRWFPLPEGGSLKTWVYGHNGCI